jgi:hypothetical protein
MNAIRDVTYRNFCAWPARKEGLENSTAYRTMQTANCIYRSAATDREVRHVEGLIAVVGIQTAQRQQMT